MNTNMITYDIRHTADNFFRIANANHVKIMQIYNMSAKTCVLMYLIGRLSGNHFKRKCQAKFKVELINAFNCNLRISFRTGLPLVLPSLRFNAFKF